MNASNRTSPEIGETSKSLQHYKPAWDHFGIGSAAACRCKGTLWKECGAKPLKHPRKNAKPKSANLIEAAISFTDKLAASRPCRIPDNFVFAKGNGHDTESQQKQASSTLIHE